MDVQDPPPYPDEQSPNSPTPPPKPPFVYTPILEYQEFHPFHNAYHIKHLESDSFNDIEIQDFQNFRNMCVLWEKIGTEKGEEPVRVLHEEMKTISRRPTSFSAIYILKEIPGDCGLLVPYHREIVADDRPDLHMIRLNNHSRDLLNPGPPSLKNYIPGDAICVISLRRLLNATEMLRTFDGVLDYNNHKFWGVGDFYLIKRDFKENILMTRIIEKRKSVDFIANQFNMPVKGGRGTETREKLLLGTIFVPKFHPGAISNLIKDGNLRNDVLRRTQVHSPGYKIPPLAIQIREAEPQVLSTNSLEHTIQFAMFGVSGILSMRTFNQDPKIYLTEINDITITRQGHNVQFSLQGTSHPPRSSQWTNGTHFSMKNDSELTFYLQVMSSVERAGRLVVQAAMIGEYRINQVLMGNAIVFQNIPTDNYLKYFPSWKDIERIPEDSPIRVCLMALQGSEEPALSDLPQGKKSTTKNLNPETTDFSDPERTFSTKPQASFPALVVTEPGVLFCTDSELLKDLPNSKRVLEASPMTTVGSKQQSSTPKSKLSLESGKVSCDPPSQLIRTDSKPLDHTDSTIPTSHQDSKRLLDQSPISTVDSQHQKSTTETTKANTAGHLESQTLNEDSSASVSKIPANSDPKPPPEVSRATSPKLNTVEHEACHLNSPMNLLDSSSVPKDSEPSKPIPSLMNLQLEIPSHLDPKVLKNFHDFISSTEDQEITDIDYKIPESLASEIFNNLQGSRKAQEESSVSTSGSEQTMSDNLPTEEPDSEKLNRGFSDAKPQNIPSPSLVFPDSDLLRRIYSSRATQISRSPQKDEAKVLQPKVAGKMGSEPIDGPQDGIAKQPKFSNVKPQELPSPRLINLDPELLKRLQKPKMTISTISSSQKPSPNAKKLQDSKAISQGLSSVKPRELPRSGLVKPDPELLKQLQKSDIALKVSAITISRSAGSRKSSSKVKIIRPAVKAAKKGSNKAVISQGPLKLFSKSGALKSAKPDSMNKAKNLKSSGLQNTGFKRKAEKVASPIATKKPAPDNSIQDPRTNPDSILPVLLGKLTLTPEQDEFLNAIVHGTSPAIVVDSCFRTGKTFLTAIAANLCAYHNRGLHIVTSTTDYGVESLIEKHMVISDRVPGVRFGSNSAKPALDFNALWPNVFWDEVLKTDRNAWSNRQMSLIESALYHLHANNLLSDNIWELRSAQTISMVQGGKLKAHMDLYETFLRIYKPRIVFGTIQDLVPLLAKGYIEDVQKVFFDDASRLPFHGFLALGAYCPVARFAILGDSRQLPPYVDSKLPSFLKTYAIGDFFKKACKTFPCISFDKVYGTPGKTLKICAQSFYGSKLHSVAGNNTIKKLLGDYIGNQYPLQLVKFQCILEDSKEVESYIAWTLIQKLHYQIPEASFGILRLDGSLPDRRLQLPNVFIGTPESTQGRYFDVAIIITTTSEVSKESWNVALSRATSYSFLIVMETEELKKKKKETSFLRKIMHEIPKKAVHDAQQLFPSRGVWSIQTRTLGSMFLKKVDRKSGQLWSGGADFCSSDPQLYRHGTVADKTHSCETANSPLQLSVWRRSPSIQCYYLPTFCILLLGPQQNKIRRIEEHVLLRQQILKICLFQLQFGKVLHTINNSTSFHPDIVENI